MARFLRLFGMRLKSLLNAQVPFPPPTISQVMAAFSILGFGSLLYLCGAAVMFFHLPSSDYLDKAFSGTKAWEERGRSSIPSRPVDAAGKQEGIIVDQAEKTSDGFTLYTMTDGARATLIDMRGTVVHQWEMPFSQAFSHPPHVASPLPDEQIHWFRCHLYPNGDVLAIYHADGDTPYGYGLVKLDKDSKLLWAYANNVHHDVDVGEDGTIYTLTHKIVSERPAGLEFLETPYLSDSLVVLSSEGRELQTIPLAEAFANSPYALALTSGSNPVKPILSSGPNDTSSPDNRPQTNWRHDLLHTNSVKVLGRTLAAKFPLFKAGQVLLSVRNIDIIAVLDRDMRTVVWAAKGFWQSQHDAEFLNNGHLLLYDNMGSMRETRVLEYDPRTQAIPWSYANENSTSFSAFLRGMKQRLPNGNTLILDPDNRRLFEVTCGKELVWEIVCPLPPVEQGQSPKAHVVNSMRRYRAHELTFLKGMRPRP